MTDIELQAIIQSEEANGNLRIGVLHPDSVSVYHPSFPLAPVVIGIGNKTDEQLEVLIREVCGWPV